MADPTAPTPSRTTFVFVKQFVKDTIIRALSRLTERCISTSARHGRCCNCYCYYHRFYQAVAKKLHKVDVDVKLMPRCPHVDGSTDPHDDHGEFRIEEKNKSETHESTVADHVEILSGGNSFEFHFLFSFQFV